MAQLRKTTRQVANEMYSNRGLIQDAMARLEEANNGHHVSPFCGLSVPDHESLPSEDEDTDSGEMVLYSREMKDPKLLLENRLEPISGFKASVTPERYFPKLRSIYPPKVVGFCQWSAPSGTSSGFFGKKDLVQSHR